MSLHRPTLDTRGNLVLPDTLDFLAEFDMHRYRLQRRLIGSTYQISSLLKYEHAVDEVMRNALIQLRDLNGAQVDLKEWMHIVTVECLTAIALSWSPGYLRSNTDGGSSSHAYLGWRRKSVFGLFPWAEIADSYNRAFGRLFAKAWGLTFKTPSNFKPFFPAVGTKVSKRVNAALRPNPAKDARKDLAAELIQLHKDKPDFNEQYLRRMIMTNFGAGHETTTSTLISVLAMLGTHTEAQARVHAETDRLATDRAISYQDAVGMTFTQAAIKEAQRLHPVLGMSPSRTVPAGGTYINGYYLLPKTIVGCNPVSLHRNPDIFGPDSDHFIPERWLDRGDTKDMDRCNLIWGGGARTCPGRNLAQMIVYKVVAALMREFRVEVEMPPEEAVKYYFMAMLTGVKVRFLERTKEETLE